MVKESFSRIDLNLPRVDVPDWELVQQLVDLIRPYARGGDDPDFWAVEARDSRGTYSETEVEALKSAVERRGEVPESIEIRVRGFEREAGTFRQLEVATRAKRASNASLVSGDEAIVAHVFERTVALLKRAAARRGTNKAPEPAQPAISQPGWRRWVHNPNPWALIIGGTAAAGLIVVIVVAIWPH